MRPPARPAARHVPRRSLLPRHRRIGRARARAARHRRRGPGPADLLRPAGLQRRLHRRRARAGAPHDRRPDDERRSDRHPVRLVRRHGDSPVRRAASPTTRSTRRRRRALAARTYEFTRSSWTCCGVTDVGATATGDAHLSRVLPRPARPRRADAAGGAARRRRCAPTHCPLPGSGRLLRIRRPLRREDGGHLGGDARPQARCDRGERRRRDRRHRRELRDAHGRRPAPARQPGARVPPRRRAGRRALAPGSRRDERDAPPSRSTAASRTRSPTRSVRHAVLRTSGRVLDSAVAPRSTALPDADAWRDHARRIRAHTLATLDHYLDTFVVRRRSARRPRPLRRDRRRRGALRPRSGRRRAACRWPSSRSRWSARRSSSTRRSRRAGIEVVETDLGEYVVQLAHDRPSHIVAPIIHKTKEDVRPTLFREKLGATDEEVAGRRRR